MGNERDSEEPAPVPPSQPDPRPSGGTPMNAPFHPSREAYVESRPRVEPRPRPQHDARLLTAGGTEATIVLDGTLYVLHITRQGKLILTK